MDVAGQSGTSTAVALARRCCVELQRTEYMVAARSLATLSELLPLSDPILTEEVEHFVAQARRHLLGIGKAFDSDTLLSACDGPDR
jgi:hypothetical protein